MCRSSGRCNSKTTGIPTYHLHMPLTRPSGRERLVIRGESGFLHFEFVLFEKLGLNFQYIIHRSADEMGEDGSKRKLSRSVRIRAFLDCA